jgi:anti-sigma regulatory factor (Ser/Thr protein kinase)
VDQQVADGDGESPQLLLQRALLPARLPAIDGLPLTARYLPAGSPDRIGGDWYDVVVLDGGAVALVVGAVAGSDLEATALTAQLRGAVRAYTLEGHPPAAVVTRANEFHLGLESGRLAALAYALVHPAERIVTVVRAGHVPPLLASPGEAPCLLDAVGGPPLGARSGEVWRESTAQVSPGSLLILYSDGLLREDGGVLDLDAGLARLLTAVEQDHPGPDPESVADLLTRLVPGPPAEDAVLLVCRLSGDDVRPGPTLRRTLPPTAESASVARWLVNDLLRDLVDADTRDTAALLTTELVSNAIRHTRDELVITVRLVGGRLRVGVSDSSHRRPQLVQVGSRDTSGRGLHLVEAMADRWGVDPDDRGLGKTVWFELVAGTGD